MNGKMNKHVSKLERRKKIIRNSKIALLIMALILILVFIVFGILYNTGSFTINLDRNLYFKQGIIIYDNVDYKVFRSELYAKSLEYFDNISHKWLPGDLHEHNGGSHNGNNYLAYTFYIENMGEHETEYYSEIIIDEVIKNVDEAIRIRVYRDDEIITYAKIGTNGEPEPGTVPFETDTLVARRHIENFKPGDSSKYTIVLWLEGNDPECTDNLLGGNIKIHMDFKSEIVEK